MTYFLKMKRNTKGAPLAEYVILMAFISFFALSAVLHLGDEVRDVFDDVADVLSETGPVVVVPTSPNLDGEIDAPTFVWEGDGSDSIPPGVSVIPNGWVMDINEILPADADRTEFRFNAWISQTGSFEVREGWPASTSSYSINVRSYWERGGETPIPIAQRAESLTPSGILTVYGETIGGFIPSDATGIRFERIFGCNSGSVCTNGAFGFNIDIYARP